MRHPKLNVTMTLVILGWVSFFVYGYYIKPKMQPSMPSPTAFKLPKPPTSKIRLFLARIAREPSPCPDLLANVDRKIDQGVDLNDLLARLERCKWKRQTFAENMEHPEQHILNDSYPDPWPEEFAIRKVIAAMAMRVRPPAGVSVYTVPHGGKPALDGVLGDEEWRDALEFAFDAIRTWIFLKSDGDFLYLGVSVPRSYDSNENIRPVFHTHLSPFIKKEQFDIFDYRHYTRVGDLASTGRRFTDLIPEPDKVALLEKAFRRNDPRYPKEKYWWRIHRVTEYRIFPSQKAAMKVAGGRRSYEIAISLKDVQIPKGPPFSFALEMSGPEDAMHPWPFIYRYLDGVEGVENWEVWLKIPE